MIEDLEIEELRRRIDALDLQLLDLLAERHRIVLAIGERKRQKHLPVQDPGREAALLERLAEVAPSPLDEATVRRVFTSVLAESRRLQERHIRDKGETPSES